MVGKWRKGDLNSGLLTPKALLFAPCCDNSSNSQTLLGLPEEAEKHKGTRLSQLIDHLTLDRGVMNSNPMLDV